MSLFELFLLLLFFSGRREKDTGKLYSLVAFESMWELGIWAFIRTVHVNDITRVSSGYEATGVSLAKEITGKQFGNKGGVGVSFAWCGVPLCFINAHLAARPTRIKEREVGCAHTRAPLNCCSCSASPVVLHG